MYVVCNFYEPKKNYSKKYTVLLCNILATFYLDIFTASNYD